MRLLAISVVLSLTVLVTAKVTAVPISIKFTSDALGFGNSDINKGKTVDPDMPGFFTSPAIGQGSFLNVQTNGLAGPGTVTDPLLLTVTARTHLDTLFGLPPSPHDYQAGVIYISKENDKTPDGKDEGLGVRAFTVVEATGQREIDSDSGLAKIEGSKDVSGGTNDDTYNLLKPNGAPHVDEAVNFNFNSSLLTDAQSVEVLLSKFITDDIIDLHIELVSGATFDFAFLKTSDTSIFEQLGDDKDKLWRFKFSGIDQLQAGDLIDNFSIRANDDDPLNPRGTAEHFWVTGITADVDVIPEPVTVLLLALGGVNLIRRRRRS